MTGTMQTPVTYNPADMPTRSNAAGRETREEVKAELRRQRAAGRNWMSVRALARKLGKNHAGLLRIVKNMAEDDEVVLEIEDVTDGLRLMRVSLPPSE